MGIVNIGSQFFSFAFHAPAKGREFNRINRDVLKPGIYQGMDMFFSGNEVFVNSGKIVINCEFDSTDNLLMKIDFLTLSPYGTILPSQYGDNEILYIEYEYAEVTENYADFKHQSLSSWLLSPNPNAIILGELTFDNLNNITGIDYSRKTWGLINADNDYSIPDNILFHNTDNYSKRWKIKGSNLSSQDTSLSFQTLTENQARILLTNSTNTTIVENRLQVAKFDGRCPLGSVIPVVGTFDSADNSGSVISPSLPVSGEITDDGWQLCDGTAVGSGGVLSGYVPKINDDRFIQGSSSLGSVGGAVDNEITLTVNELPSHSHTINASGDLTHSHNISWIQGTIIWRNVAPNGNNAVPSGNQDILSQLPTNTENNTHSLSHIHTVNYTGNGQPFNIRPKYISAIYMIRVR